MSADLVFLDQAADLAFHCPPTDKAFAVGCVIVAPDGKIITTGYSREWGDAWHAEEVAIEKARRESRDLIGATLYSSVEPCSTRLSGKPSCCSHILGSGISRVVFALREPSVFVEGKGLETLENAGITVLEIHNPAVEKKIARANPSIL